VALFVTPAGIGAGGLKENANTLATAIAESKKVLFPVPGALGLLPASMKLWQDDLCK